MLPRSPTPWLWIICLFFVSPMLAVDTTSPDRGRFNFISGQKKVNIPFYTFNNQIILSVRVNSKIPLNFILDSGSSQAILFDRQLARDLEIPLGRRIEFSGAGNSNKVIAHRSTGVKLQLPGIEGDMMGMVVLSQDYMDMKRFDIHGVIGYQLFVRFAIKVDYAQRILTVMEPDQYSSRGFFAFDLQIESSKPFINTEILLVNNQQVTSKLMIDTGAAYGLSLIIGTHPAINVPKKTAKSRIASGLGGDISGHSGVTRLKLCPGLTPEVSTLYIHPDEYTRKGNFRYNKMGSIGGEFLRDYLVIFDYINSKVFIRPQSADYISQAGSHN